MKSMRKGAILAFALVATFIVVVLVGSMGAYYASSARLADRYMTGRSEPRAFAQAVMENVNQFIVNEVGGALNPAGSSGSDPSISIITSGSGGSLDSIIEGVKTKISNVQSNDEYCVEISAERVKDSSRYLLRVVTTVYRDKSKQEILSQIEEIIEFRGSSSDAMTTIPIFDYVYFANNSGRLVSPYIIANGEIGANGDFLINGATVNGYVDVTGTVSLEGAPKASPRKTYMTAISKEYATEFTPARPTNKLYDSDGNGQEWIGGYEPAKATHSFVDPGPAPTEVADPGEAPSPPTVQNPEYPPEPQLAEVPDPQYPSEPTYPQQNTGVYKYAYTQPEKGKGDYAYPNPPSYYSYDKWYSARLDFRYPNAPYSTAAIGGKYWWYDPLDGVVKNYGKNESGKNAANAAYASDKQTQDAKCDAENQRLRDEWNQKCAAKDAAYETAYALWDADKKAKDAAWANKCKEMKDQWLAQCAAIKAQWDKDNDAALKKYQTEHDDWQNNQLPAYVAGTNAYITAWKKYDQDMSAYDGSNKLYQAYTMSNAVWQASVAQYESDMRNWYISVENGTFKQSLNEMSESETPLLLIRTPGVDGVPYVAMPVDSNKTYVADYRDTVCKGGAGTLECANRYKSGSSDKNISWSRTGQKFEEWYYAYKATSSFGNPKRTAFPEGHIFGTNSVNESTLTRTLAYVKVKDGYEADIYPFAARRNQSLTNTGMDSYYSDSELKQAEKGSVILIGTANYPITIKGPVWFDGDVVIRGFVSGQGSIYAGRNIHIIGDITYLNPPNWPNTKKDISSSTIPEVKSKNANKDLLLLVARGNIIVGDYPSQEWQKDCREYLQIPQGYRSTGSANYSECHDGDIGYGSSFSCDYSAYESAATGVGNDSNYKVTMENKLISTKLYEEVSMLEKESMWWTQLVIPYACNIRTYENTIRATKNKRRFYECKLGDEVIAGLMQSKSTDSGTESWQWSQWAIMRWLYRAFDVTDPQDNISSSQQDVSQASSAVAADLDAGDITHIDAVLYANHGIFGRVGGTASHKFTLNGAMLCRDEGLLPSFAGRAASDGWTSPLPAAWLNWDMRIKSDSSEGLRGVGAKMEQRSVSGGVTNIVTSWRQVK